MAFAYGIHDRVELFASFDLQRSINAPGIIPYGTIAPSLPKPATNLLGVPFYNNTQPFMDVPRASASGDFRFGGVYNAVSERRGRPLSVGVGAYRKMPSGYSLKDMNKGLSNGVKEGN